MQIFFPKNAKPDTHSQDIKELSFQPDQHLPNISKSSALNDPQHCPYFARVFLGSFTDTSVPRVSLF